ncbi:hypothetical protein TOPH_06215 [Tolypocladium ophioglossoides CBS 100239]|uniref:Uncharacterized protein n=1 Tax=Tolypocladium ophioglossoides (strain CBS 100239) TaxID=1163406 RepID=A0A0L0N558_TOLOC|nr:hypothetical protein TOPH_06215 [Tolypocladium ophioglossoides CBS 100239]
MPADAPHLNLCKAIMSAVALGYPPPTLLNWSGEFNRPEWHLAGSHIAKMESLLAAIEHLLSQAGDAGGASEHDLAVMVDAYDIWFQLPPSVLVERFHQLNREADDRVRRQWQAAQGLAADFPVPPPRQSIVVTSAKDCHPKRDSGSDAHYAHWPASPMPSDLYGDGTDRVLPLLFDPARKYRKMRPRCVNSGLVMGTMGAMRDALRRCKAKIEGVARSGRQLWSDQALLGEVIGDQEMWREWMRGLGATWNGTASENDMSGLSREVRDVAEAALRGDGFEFGIGLDYNFTTIPPTCSAEEDGFFVRINDKAALRNESIRAGVPGAVRVQGIPRELQRLGRDDDDAAAAAAANDALSNVSWGDVPLYTDLYFGTTPVGIHHNAYINGLKPWRIRNWWNMTWFHPHLRSLVSRRLVPRGDAPARPLARLAPRADGARELVYWAPEDDHGSKQVTVFAPSSAGAPAGGTFSPIDWDGVCQRGPTPWHEELFGDGQAPLELK